MTDPARYRVAALLCVLLAAYVTVFARRTHDIVDLPSFIGLTEWPATLLYAAAAVLALRRRARAAALALVAALLAFYAAQARWLFDVPLGFVLSTVLVFVTLFVLPPDRSR